MVGVNENDNTYGPDNKDVGAKILLSEVCRMHNSLRSFLGLHILMVRLLVKYVCLQWMVIPPRL